MEDIQEHQQLPDLNQLSVLTSTILLAYAVTPFIDTSSREVILRLPGAAFSFQFSLSSILSLIAAALAAIGTDWLVRSHPRLQGQITFQHWLLPAFTAWVIGVPLNTLMPGPQWWAVFAFGSLLLVLVFTAEYIVVDLSDDRQVPATVGLTAVSFALYLVLAITVRAAGLRLYLLLPALVIPMALVCLRALYLRLGGQWYINWAVGIALIIGQLAIGIHYMPLSPLVFGLILLGPAYALTSVAGSIEEGRPWRTLWIEPAIMLAILWGLAFLFRN
ncbi:MAG: hypothetical protein GYA17_02685 [Chloroflexi bacterium]|nr:hypothetical protein [Anaerolineaceae bacterium]NMB87237.1 hypothetical protein [Chloroflexota bacterium]